MALTINTNVASLNAQRNMGQSQGALNKSMQRLSSGLRINSAKDDAAGLAISDRMTSQIRGLNQAVRNANDGISLSQTAEGALQETTNILQRIREIAVQSSNDTNSVEDRASLNAEVTQLMAEVNRIADTTAFNGKVLLAGGFSGATNQAVFQVGADAGQTIGVNIGAATGEALGLNSVAFAATSTLTAAGTSTLTSAGTSTLTSAGNGSTIADTYSVVADTFSVVAATYSATAAGTGALTVATFAGAQAALAAIDTAISSVDTVRGDLGAVQNRFESTIANLSNVAENLTAARSRILDADIAQETSNMTKQNILQQAGVAILAQANQAPSLALSLLQ